MDVDKDYYSILGVLPTIEETALAAVYRALVKKYHPDVFSGAKDEAERIAKQLNEAYSVVGNPRSRADYDRQRARQQRRSGDFEGESGRTDDGRGPPDDALRAAWHYIVRYYPDAESHRIELAVLSSSLAVSYQVALVETKSAATAKQLSDGLRLQFMERYFGTNTAIYDFVLDALRARRRDVAIEVNRAIKVVGSPNVGDTATFIATVRQVTGWGVASQPKATSTAAAASQHKWSGADWVTVFGALLAFSLLLGWLFRR